MKSRGELEEKIAAMSAVCGRCGSCRSTCPIYREIKWESSSPRGKIALAKDIFLRKQPSQMTESYIQRLLECTLCGQCTEICAAGLDTRELWLELRENLAQTGHLAPAFQQLSEQVESKHNISSTPNAYRLDWAEDLDELEVLENETGKEVAYFVGCVASFFPQLSELPQSIVKILDRAQVPYTLLGGEEWCCGFPLIAAGLPEKAKECAQHNVEVVRALGVKTLITGCASCYHTWYHDYPELLGEPLGFEVQHVTQFLAGLIRDKKIPLHKIEETVTYHDPCDLGRNGGIFDDPREILKAIPGLHFVEMLKNRKEADCCGGGGNLQSINPELSQAIALKRVEAAEATGASLLVSACQQCVQTLRLGARKNKRPIEVLDIVELLLRAIEEEEENEDIGQD